MSSSSISIYFVYIANELCQRWIRIHIRWIRNSKWQWKQGMGIYIYICEWNKIWDDAWAYTKISIKLSMESPCNDSLTRTSINMISFPMMSGNGYHVTRPCSSHWHTRSPVHRSPWPGCWSKAPRLRNTIAAKRKVVAAADAPRRRRRQPWETNMRLMNQRVKNKHTDSTITHECQEKTSKVW